MIGPLRADAAALGMALAVGAVVTVAASGPGLSAPPPATVPDWRPSLQTTPVSTATLSPIPLPGSDAARGSDTVLAAILALVLLGSFIALAFALRHLRDRRPHLSRPVGPPTGDSIPTRTKTAAHRSREQLTAGNITGNQAVIATWRAFESDASRRGVTRSAAETSDSYAHRVAAVTRADASSVSVLEQLFVEAVYGTGEVDVEEARHCLDAVIRSWSP